MEINKTGASVAERFKLYTNCGMDAHGTYGQQYKVFRSLQDAMFFIEGDRKSVV